MKLKFLFSCLFGFFLVSAVPTRNREIEPVVVTNIQMLALNDPKAEDWAKKQMASMTLEDKLGQFFMVAARSNGGEKHLLEIDSLVQKEKVGGIILFQGEKSNVKEAILRFQSKSEVPLFIGMDAEWGTDMRLFDGERFPFAYTIGAANDSLLSSKVSSIMVTLAFI